MKWMIAQIVVEQKICSEYINVHAKVLSMWNATICIILAGVMQLSNKEGEWFSVNTLAACILLIIGYVYLYKYCERKGLI